MARFKVFGSTADGLWGWGNLHHYSVANETRSRIVLRWDESKGGALDADLSPWKIALRLDDGAVTRIDYFAKGRDGLAAKLTGIELDADLARLYLDPDVDRPWLIYDLAIAEGASFIGRKGDARDYLITGIGDDVAQGRAGRDVFYDRGGADRYVGGSGTDAVSYIDWFHVLPERAVTGVRADLRRGFIEGPDGLRDAVVSVEDVEGSFLDDVLKGDGARNGFWGMRGADVIDGRGGYDYALYNHGPSDGASSGIKARLDRGWVRDPWGDRDRVRNVEGITGTDWDDSIRDDGGDNYFFGYGGDDVLIFGRGFDQAEGGPGADRFVFRGSRFGVDTIDDFDGREGDRIEIRAADGLRDVSIVRDDGDTFLSVGDNVIVLEDYTGKIEPYLIF